MPRQDRNDYFHGNKNKGRLDGNRRKVIFDKYLTIYCAGMYISMHIDAYT